MISSIFSLHKQPRLSLVGAGPGDPDLLTLKAIKVLQEADIVLYDALVSPEIIDRIPSGTPALSVGKRYGAHAFSQDEINELIVEFAYLYGHVVRLKGGDPFVFARGSEELDYAYSHGVTTQVVPGISSALAVPAAASIPVTARGVSESFWVITGTTSSGTISDDIQWAAKSTATVVILMGMHNLAGIMQRFADAGRTTTPVAIIQNGTLPSQRCVIGNVSTIVDLASKSNMGSPAIIVIGEVARNARSVASVLEEVQHIRQ